MHAGGRPVPDLIVANRGEASHVADHCMIYGEGFTAVTELRGV